MSLTQTLFLVVIALVVRLVFPGQKRHWAILALSIAAIYWLQPALPIRQMDFWFPTASLGLVLISWGLTAEPGSLKQPVNAINGSFAMGMVAIIGLTRYISLEGIVTASRPPQFTSIITVLVTIIALTLLLTQIQKRPKSLIVIALVLILALLTILKNPALSLLSSIRLRSLLGQNPTLAKKTDLAWLGYSYLAFRIIHTLIDQLSGRLKGLMLGDYIIYTIFYPAFLAGPLDRFQRFQKDLADFKPLNSEALFQQLTRLARGLFRKFILADTLAFFALSNVNASQVKTPGWLWVMTIAYSFQLFLDFAGYTDIAIAAAGLLGVNLPDNFNQPYRQPNLTIFWNNWHITLTQWFRSYFFNPLTRYLRRNKKISVPVIIFTTQMGTMLIIGLWHGVTLNFLIWGAWHGLGLFIHNRWAGSFGHKIKSLADTRSWLQPVLHGSSVFATFIFTTLGWIWFVLPNTTQAWRTFIMLLGG